MAHGTKTQPASAASLNNGFADSRPSVPDGTTVNRKKQKRRAKQAAKDAAEAEKHITAPTKNGLPAQGPGSKVPTQPPHGQPAPRYAEPELDIASNYNHEAEYGTDEEGDSYGHHHDTNGHYRAGYAEGTSMSGASKKGRKKKKATSGPHQESYHPPAPAAHTYPAPSSVPMHKSNSDKDRIWNTSTQEERERIREFWLSLGEEERKSLVKIEKEAVLRKMKEQQKHSCSCTVCGRKRTAIEEELEVLYDAYYEELEQYANHQQDAVGPILPPAHYSHAHPHATAHRHRALMTTHPPADIYDETDDLSQGDEEEEGQDFSTSEISSEDGYSSEERSLHAGETDFLQFGSSLQVKGGILTVADDLLKNDGKKFIEMMEQLAERRMQREEEAQYQTHPSYRSHGSHSHPADRDEADYDDDEDEEEGYDDDDYEDDEEEESVSDEMTEEQRMEEGRRMFQIFAARMFEQRVLQAYREKVAAERQQKLLEELAEEDAEEAANKAKKAKEAVKRKEKKEKQKLAKAEEKARKEAELAAKEADLKAAEEKRLEEQRRKKDEQRKKKELERKTQEEEKHRKDAERLKRQHDERERQQETERKARELKAQEKKLKEETRRKEREEREVKEREIREKKAQEERDRKERESKAKAERERLRKEEQSAASMTAASSKKSSQPVAVALPPGLLKQSSSTGFPSPHVTPAVPKAPTPNRPRQSSQQDSHGSPPKTPHLGSGTSKSISPTSQAQHATMPKSILTKPPNTQVPMHPHHVQPSSPMPPIGPPPGMMAPPGMGIGMPPGLNGFPHAGSPMMAGMNGPRHSIGHNLPMFPQQPAPQQYRGFPPPGMPIPNAMPLGPRYPLEGPPGFNSMPAFGLPNPIPGFGMGMPSHSRQGSGSFDKSSTEGPTSIPQAQPIQRPAPIQRPSSVKPHEDVSRTGGSDIDELASHLGSKALLDDGDDLPDFPQPEPRRPSVQTHGSLRGAPMGFGAFGDPALQPRSDSYAPFGTPGNPGNMWSTPIPFPMGGGAGWGNSPTSSLFNSPFHGAMLGMPRPGEQRLVWIRRLLCQTCKSMVRQVGPDGYLDAPDVHHQLDTSRNPIEPAISPLEIKEACDIFGDSANGGGTLEYKVENGLTSGRITHIKFIDDHRPPQATLGEIGSPIPSHSVPVGGGFGNRPFPGLGPPGY